MGLDQIELGKNRAEIEAILGEGKEFEKVAGFPPVVMYPELGVLLHFEKGALAAIEAGGTGDVSYHGVTLLRRPLLDVVHDLEGLGLEARRDENGADIGTIGLGLYAPGDDVEGITVYVTSA
ncbi:MAG: hypothetical protein ACRDGD_03405 [Candidatus Limnocylindria bacterium]